MYSAPGLFRRRGGIPCILMDRAFYAKSQLYRETRGRSCELPPGGSTATFDQINKYFTIFQMPIVSPVLEPGPWEHAGEVVKDEEGMQTMRTLGNNMAGC